MASSEPLVWLITGVNAGFGHHLALIAREAGHTVYGSVRSPSKFPAELQSAGVRPIELPLPCSEAAASAAVSSVVSGSGRLDVLINNAGYSHLGMLEEATDEEISEQFGVNVLSPFALIRAALPVFRAQQAAGSTPSGSSGVVVNLSSIGGITGAVGAGVYCGSKHALEGMTESLAMEVTERFGVRVHLVLPGYFRTSFLAKQGAGQHSGRRRLADAYPQSATDIYAAYHAAQPGDPREGMQRLFEFVTGTGMARGKGLDKQLRLYLGSDCVQMTEDKLKAFRDNFDRSREIAMSTDLS